MEHHQRTFLAAQGYCELSMYDDALAELASLPGAVQQEPIVVEMRLMTYMQARRWNDGLAQARELSRLRPHAASGFIHAAFCLHELGHTAEAKRTLTEGPPELRGEANYYYNLACYECVLGNLEAARALLETSITMDAKYREYSAGDPDLRALNL